MWNNFVQLGTYLTLGKSFLKKGLFFPLPENLVRLTVFLAQWENSTLARYSS